MIARAIFPACALLALAALPVTLAAGSGSSNAGLVPLTPPLQTTDDHAPAFRLGTAARPFGWSTAIADLNADGRPDLVVADRVPSNRAAYRLDISLAGEPSATEVFQTAEEAVGIRVVDVDHDADLDIVLASVASGRTIGVWLNDGAGHFTRSSSRVSVPASLTGPGVDHRPGTGAFDPGDIASRRVSGAAPSRARAPTPSALAAGLSLSHVRLVVTPAYSLVSPRAPPAPVAPVRL